MSSTIERKSKLCLLIATPPKVSSAYLLILASLLKTLLPISRQKGPANEIEQNLFLTLSAGLILESNGVYVKKLYFLYTPCHTISRKSKLCLLTSFLRATTIWRVTCLSCYSALKHIFAHFQAKRFCKRNRTKSISNTTSR